MKRTIFVLLIILVFVKSLAACDGKIGRDQLDKPENVYLDGKIVNWNAVEGANRYVVTIETDYGGYSLTQKETSYEVPIEVAGSYRIYIVARDIDGRYLDSDKSAIVEYIMGQGIADDPIRIYSETELKEIGIGANIVGGETTPYYYVLERDINLQGQEWKPIGVGDNRFQGHFDGQGYTISNFKITKADGGYYGLFGGVNKGSIRNLNVKDYNINLSANGRYRIGGLAGFVTNSIIENCHVEGNINYRAPSWNASSKPDVNSQYIGQLIGHLQTNTNPDNFISRISGCSAAGDLQVEAYTVYAGGLVGYNYGSIIEQSFAKGDVYSKGRSLYVGGLAGGSLFSNSKINNSYSRVDVVTEAIFATNVGSLIGYFYNNSTLEYSYATGSVTAKTSSTYQVGFIGLASGTLYLKSSYFDYESIGINKARGNSSGSSNLTNVHSRTTEQMKNKDNYNNFDFDNIWDIDPDVNDGYPILRAYIPPIEEEED